MDAPHLDLQAYLCPNAMILAKRAINVFLGSAMQVMKITSIDPALERNLNLLLAHEDLPLNLQVQEEKLVTDELRTAWLDEFDPEDFEGFDVQRLFIISKRTA